MQYYLGSSPITKWHGGRELFKKLLNLFSIIIWAFKKLFFILSRNFFIGLLTQNTLALG